MSQVYHPGKPNCVNKPTIELGLNKAAEERQQMPGPTGLPSPPAWEGRPHPAQHVGRPCPARSGSPASHLLGQPPCEEGVQVLGVQPQKALEVLPSDVVGLVLFLGELRQVLGLDGVALCGAEAAQEASADRAGKPAHHPA